MAAARPQGEVSHRPSLQAPVVHTEVIRRSHPAGAQADEARVGTSPGQLAGQRTTQ
jgi:hypothetical protein